LTLLTLPKNFQELKVSRQLLGHELLTGLIMAIVTIPSGLTASYDGGYSTDFRKEHEHVLAR
jgi:hypothetical protein